MGARVYAPNLGRFFSVDPVSDGSTNAYEYCFADPVNCTDITGTVGVAIQIPRLKNCTRRWIGSHDHGCYQVRCQVKTRSSKAMTKLKKQLKRCAKGAIVSGAAGAIGGAIVGTLGGPVAEITVPAGMITGGIGGVLTGCASMIWPA